MEYIEALNLLILLESMNNLTPKQSELLEEANEVVRLFNMLDKKAA